MSTEPAQICCRGTWSIRSSVEGCCLLRNCALEQLAGFAVEEGEAEMGGTLAQAVKDANTVLGIVGGGAGILVHQALPEGAIHQDRQLPGGDGNGLGLALPVCQAPIEVAESRVAADEIHCDIV